MFLAFTLNMVKLFSDHNNVVVSMVLLQIPYGYSSKVMVNFDKGKVNLFLSLHFLLCIEDQIYDLVFLHDIFSKR